MEILHLPEEVLENMYRLLKQFRFRVHLPILYDWIVEQAGEEVFGTDSVQCHSEVKSLRQVLLRAAGTLQGQWKRVPTRAHRSPGRIETRNWSLRVPRGEHTGGSEPEADEHVWWHNKQTFQHVVCVGLTVSVLPNRTTHTKYIIIFNPIKQSELE